MSTSKEYLYYIQEQLSAIDGISYRAMMGEYVIYYKDKVAGGIYDNRFLIKQTAAAKRLLPGASLVIPYSGAKEMILIEDAENAELMLRLFENMYGELPALKRRRK